MGNKKKTTLSDKQDMSSNFQNNVRVGSRSGWLAVDDMFQTEEKLHEKQGKCGADF